MNLAVNIGNSNIAFGFFDGAELVATFRIKSDPLKSSDEFRAQIATMMASLAQGATHPGRIMLCSVVPNLTRAIEKALTSFFETSVEQVTPQTILSHGLANVLDIPELGMDIAANLALAHSLHPTKSTVVVDFGTATTFEVVDAAGIIRGVTIAPGLITSLNALVAGAAQLRPVELKAPRTALGLNTEDSIRSGMLFGWAGLAKEIIARIEAELGGRPYVVATGGMSATICQVAGIFDQVDPVWTLRAVNMLIG